MLEVQTSSEVDKVNSNFDTTESDKKSIQDFLYGKTDIPFASFFNSAFVCGMFKNLGDVERLKKNNPTYKSYIDRWLVESIRLKFIKILKDGEIVLIFDLNSVPRSVFINKKELTVSKCKNVLEKISSIAKNHILNKVEGMSSLNYFVVKNDLALMREMTLAYNDFYTKMGAIVKKSQAIKDDSKSDKLHYVSIASCTVTPEVFNEL